MELSVSAFAEAKRSHTYLEDDTQLLSKKEKENSQLSRRIEYDRSFDRYISDISHTEWLKYACFEEVYPQEKLFNQSPTDLEQGKQSTVAPSRFPVLPGGKES